MKKWILLILTIEMSLVSQVFGAGPTSAGEMIETKIYDKVGLDCNKDEKSLPSDLSTEKTDKKQPVKAGSAQYQ